MKTVTVINAKGGCGKSTIATSLAVALAKHDSRVLLIDMDPQAQVTQWLAAGDGLSTAGTLVAAMTGDQPLRQVVQETSISNLWFVASAAGLEDLGRQITDFDDYPTILARLLASLGESMFDLVVIDSPNQISPVMENAIWPSDLFIVPFESTKAVRSYANFYKLLARLRPEHDYQILHVLSNLTRQAGLRKHVIRLMEQEGISRARAEMRSCGWLAQIDEHGGSIFNYRPHSKGASDISNLMTEVAEHLELPMAAVPL